jgi:hypothetical protein
MPIPELASEKALWLWGVISPGMGPIIEREEGTGSSLGVCAGVVM